MAPTEVYRRTFGVKFGLALTLELIMASAKTDSTLSLIYHIGRHLVHHLPVKTVQTRHLDPVTNP